jgi:hypothetical protein
MTTPREFFAQAHDRAEPLRARERQKMLAALYQPNATYNQILTRRAQEGDALWRQLPTTTHLAIAHYVEQREAYQAEHGEGDAS